VKKIAVLFGVLLWASAAFAQSQYPNRPIRFIVGFPPGGSADPTTRIIGAALQEQLGQPVVVENRPGADSAIAAEQMTRMPADGYTIMFASNSAMTAAVALRKQPTYDPLKDFTPISMVGRATVFFYVHPSVPAATLKEFVDHARANPGKLNYGTPGNGTSPHIATEVFNREAKVKLNHVPYKGAGPALKDLLGGQIDLAFDPGVGIAQAKAGKLRMIAIAGPQRHPDFPDVPTLEENGIRGVDGGPHFGFYAPAGTPRDLMARINSEIQKAMQDPTVRDRFKALAVDVAPPMTPQAFAAYVRSESERYARLIPELGIKSP
jgi:tripartite-type tricarboxylate transporter receptor subunit TctC